MRTYKQSWSFWAALAVLSALAAPSLVLATLVE